MACKQFFDPALEVVQERTYCGAVRQSERNKPFCDGSAQGQPRFEPQGWSSEKPQAFFCACKRTGHRRCATTHNECRLRLNRFSPDYPQ